MSLFIPTAIATLLLFSLAVLAMAISLAILFRVVPLVDSLKDKAVPDEA